MVRYFTKIGEWEDAVEELEEKGGMLFPGKDRDSPISIVRGSIVTTYWVADSWKRGELIKYCRQLGFHNEEAQDMTGGRLARWYIKNALRLPYRETLPGEKYIKLAKDGFHWHYQHCEPGNYSFGCEIDLKSAYLSALLSGESLLLNDAGQWLDDNGALERLRKHSETMPKWFRLTLLGVLAGHRLGYLHRDKSKETFELKYSEQKKIEYGCAFNAVHRAIFRNWRIMKELHEIMGTSAKRLHTDSILVCIDKNYDPYQEEKMFEKIKEYGLKTTLKRSGRVALKDLNCGFIGGKLIGAKPDVMEFMRETKQLPDKVNPHISKAGNIPSRVDEVARDIFEPEENKIKWEIANIYDRLGTIFNIEPTYFEKRHKTEIEAILPPTPPKSLREKALREEWLAVEFASKLIEKGGIDRDKDVQLELFS